MVPHQAVQRSLLAWPIRVTATLGEQRNSPFLRQVGKRTELGVTRLRKIEIVEFVILHRIDGFASLQVINQVHDQRNRLHGTDIVPRWQHVEGSHVFAEQFGLLLGECRPLDADFRRSVENAAESFALVATTEDCQEGLNAFVEKRTPNYRGR